jgi:ABC-2 type transport system ATP-binding protein
MKKGKKVIEIMHEASPLQACGLNKMYGKQTVLNGASLLVQPGSIVGLVGRNGAGKSTFIECLLGIQQVQSGQAQLFGKDPYSINDFDKSMLGYVPQRPDGFDWMTVEAMLNLIAPLYPQWDHGLVARLLAQWKLNPSQRLLTMSPGERQQVAIIRAIAPRPRLLVLDEPASALDPYARRALLREIVNLASEDGCTVLFSTHIISDLERIATHLALLHEGSMRLYGAVDDIKDTVRRLHWPATVPLPSSAIAGELSRRQLEDGSYSLVLRGEEHCTLPSGLQTQALNLEDLFVELTA